MFGKLNLKENKKSIIPDWAKILLLIDVDCFSTVLTHYYVMDELNNRINENKEKIETFKPHNDMISMDAVDNLQRENFRLGSLLKTIRSL